MALLELRNLSVHYEGRGLPVKAVNEVDLAVHPQETLGLVGESGSGKTTIGNALMGMLPAGTRVSGSARFQGKELVGMDETGWRALRWRHVAMVFQKAMSALSPVHRIGEQFYDVMAAHEPKVTRQEAAFRTRELLAAVGLRPQVAQNYPHELSGGMMQRVVIALALVHRPTLLILDEATTALDVMTQEQILMLIRELREKFKLTIVMITHDIGVVAENADRVAVMYAGHLMEAGPTQDVLSRPAHPYTAALLSAFPTLQSQRGQLRGIPGTLPDLQNLPQGCVFRPRCAFATARCATVRPELSTAPDGRQVACHHPLTHAASAAGGMP